MLFGGLTFNSDDKSQILDNTIYHFDIDSSTWAIIDFKGDFPEPRYLHSMEFFTDSSLFIFGGISCEN